MYFIVYSHDTDGRIHTYMLATPYFLFMWGSLRLTPIIHPCKVRGYVVGATKSIFTKLCDHVINYIIYYWARY